MTTNSINYDELSYPNYVFADTHPSRLAAIGRFFGISCCDSGKAKVLEIGCAGGLNILSHACSLPNAEFVAIDSSAQQINSALELQKLSSISNVKFLCQKLESIGSSLGFFDYIICHGVFSWVPQAVQHEILQLCHTILEDNGIAFISYNTLPGWHIQKILRDALLYRGQEESNSQELGIISKDFLKFAKGLFPKNAQPMLNPAIDHLLDVPDNYIAHEHLSEINSPLYFHEFNDLCKQHGLIYLGDSELGSMIPKEYHPEIQDKIMELAGGSLSKLEQYCDFFRLRQFRKSLICKNTCQPQRHFDQDRIKSLYVSASKSHLGNKYQSKGELKTTKLKEIDRQFPYAISIREFSNVNADPKIIELLLEHIMLNNLEIRDTSPRIAKESHDLSRLSPLVKALIPFGNVVPNLRSDTVSLSHDLHNKLKNNEKLLEKDLSDLCQLGLIRDN